MAGVLVGDDGSTLAGIAAGVAMALLAAAVGIPWARWSMQYRRKRIALLLEGVDGSAQAIAGGRVAFIEPAPSVRYAESFAGPAAPIRSAIRSPSRRA